MIKETPKPKIVTDQKPGINIKKPESIEIKKYEYCISSTWEDTDTKKDSYIAKIWLYEAKPCETYFADVHFHGGSNPLPDAEVFYHPKERPNERFRLHFRMSALPDIIDMLRNEKPVFLHLPHRNDKVKDVNDIAKSAHITTTAEFVGEGESP